MENNNGIGSINKYTLGSVWHWSCGLEPRNGVQSGERPVMVISNNTHNRHSASVNCVSITSALKESPVHTALYISKDSHIQCEQIHTIPKEELTEYIGVAPKPVVSNVKARLRLQLDLSTDVNTELFSSIKRSLDELNRKSNPEVLNHILAELETLNSRAATGFGLPEAEDEFLKLLLELYKHFEKLSGDIESLKAGAQRAGTLVTPALEEPEEPVEVVDDNAQLLAPEEPVESDTEKAPTKKKKRNKYTDEDKRRIADKNTPIETLMDVYGFSRPTAYKMRGYFRDRIKPSDEPKTNEPISKDTYEKSQGSTTTPSKRKNIHRKYSDSDKEYILDNNNSLEDLMAKFGYKDRGAAYKARDYIRKRASQI